MKKDLLESLDKNLDNLILDYIAKYHSEYKSRTITEIRDRMENHYETLYNQYTISNDIDRNLEDEELEFVKKKFNDGVIDRLNESPGWRNQILDKKFYTLSGHDALAILEDVELSNEQIDLMIEHLKSKFNIDGWEDHLESCLIDYFENDLIMDIHGDRVRI